MSNPISQLVELEKSLQAGLLAINELKVSLAANSAPVEEGDQDIKMADGRMSPAGIAALYNDFQNNELTNAEIAEKFDISLSGVKKRRRMWRDGR